MCVSVDSGTGVAMYARLVGALLLCVILVLSVGILAYRRSCRHFNRDITDSSSALAAAFHPGKPPRQGETSLSVSPYPYLELITSQFQLNPV